MTSRNRQPLTGRARLGILVLCAIGGVSMVAVPTAARAQSARPQWERPGADFHADGAWRAKARGIRQTRAQLLQRREFGALNRRPPAGRSASSAAAVTGALVVPVLTFYFQDSRTDNLFSIHNYLDLLFGRTPPAGRPYSLRTYFESMSDDAFTVSGTIAGWFGLPNPEAFYTGAPGSCPNDGSNDGNDNCNGFGTASSSMTAGFVEVLRQADALLDYGQFDNDGADGRPNSGDDDGFIDTAVFLHSEQDGFCGGPANNHIWAHRGFSLDFTSADPSATGRGNIKARDYIVQSAVGGANGCTLGQLMPLGVVAHELGHALDLPDLYDAGGSGTEGIGSWGLMGGGAHTSLTSPARMEAWSLAELGWVDVVPIAPGSFSFGAAPASDTTFLVAPPSPNPRGEYFLLENRQAVEADTALIRINGNGGLLIWHVDPQVVAAGRTPNRVNSGPIHGVDLIQADDRAELRAGLNRGDGGDPYPGLTGNVAFGANSKPAARLNALTNGDGPSAGFSITSIRQVAPGGAMSFTLGFGGDGGAVAILSEGARPQGIMGRVYQDELTASGEGAEPLVWALTAGALPPALTLEENGIITGELQQVGVFNFSASASQGSSTATGDFTLTVSAPDLASPALISQLTGATGIGPEDLRYLDLVGNRNGGFDLGDFLAWVNATGAQSVAGQAAVTDRRRNQ